MEFHSGQDLGEFFRQWIFTPFHPELALDWNVDEKGDRILMVVKQRQEGLPFRFPLEVEVQGAGDRERFILEISRREEQFSFPLKFRPERVDLDPDTWLLFEGR